MKPYQENSLAEIKSILKSLSELSTNIYEITEVTIFTDDCQITFRRKKNE